MYEKVGFPFRHPISFSICTTHERANASSVKRRADSLALRRIASVSCADIVRACWKAAANSVSMVAWKPGDLDQFR